MQAFCENTKIAFCEHKKCILNAKVNTYYQSTVVPQQMESNITHQMKWIDNSLLTTLAESKLTLYLAFSGTGTSKFYSHENFIYFRWRG